MEKMLKINFNQSVGTVIYFVEGGSTEFTLLKIIFGNILHYDYVEKKRGRPARFINNQCPYNRVYVINTSESNIADISDLEFLDQVCEYLINEYGLDLDNAAKFYLFDRDNQSNKDIKLIEYYLNVLTEPYGDDSQYEKGGLLLLSYPSIESFVVSNFKEDTYKLMFKLGKDIKKYIGQVENQKEIQFNKIDENTLLYATTEFLKYIEHLGEELNLDGVDELNKTIFRTQEEGYSRYEKYSTISELVLSLLYLGIIKLEP